MRELPLTIHARDGEVPESFDWRTKITTADPQNQGECGACWAIAAASAFKDRMTVSTKREAPAISAQYIKNCVRGGYMYDYARRFTWDQIGTGAAQRVGLCDMGGFGAVGVTFICDVGAPAESDVPYIENDSTCTPGVFTLYRATPGSACVLCQVDAKGTGANGESIMEGAKIPQEQIDANVENMQRDILRHGPLVAAHTVYNDQLKTRWSDSAYEDGVYVPDTTSGIDGGHAVVIVGWGRSGATPYWIVRNSWGPAWNGDGHFRMVRGRNAGGIESLAVSFSTPSTALTQKGGYVPDPALTSPISTLGYNYGTVMVLLGTVATVLMIAYLIKR